MKKLALACLVACAATLAACSPNTDMTVPIVPAVTLPHGSLDFQFHALPVVASAIPGDTVRFSILVFGRDSTITPAASGPGSLQWSTSDPSIGTVDQRGVFVPRAPGRVTISVVMFADTGNFVFTVVPRVATARIVSPTTDGIIGVAFPLAADFRSASGDSLTTDFRNLSWTSSDTTVAVLGSFVTTYNAQDARIFFKKAGTATITLTAVDERVSTSMVFTVTPLAFRNVDVDTDYGSKSYACGLSLSSKLYCWGDNLPDSAVVWYGLDRVTGDRGPAAPTPVPTTLTFDTVAVAYDHACGLTRSGDAWCWGSNSLGQLGDGTYGSEWNSAPVAVAGGHRFTAIAVAVLRSCAITAQGDAWCWGNNSVRDEFGNGLTGTTPVPMAAASGVKLKTLSLARLTGNGGSSCGETLAGVATAGVSTGWVKWVSDRRRARRNHRPRWRRQSRWCQ